MSCKADRNVRYMAVSVRCTARKKATHVPCNGEGKALVGEGSGAGADAEGASVTKGAGGAWENATESLGELAASDGGGRDACGPGTAI